jgi:hypothetical protein
MSNRSLQREMSFFGTVFTMLEESDAALRFDIFALVRLQSPLDTKLLARRMDDVLRNFSRWRSVIVPYGKGAYLWKVASTRPPRCFCVFFPTLTLIQTGGSRIYSCT